MQIINAQIETKIKDSIISTILSEQYNLATESIPKLLMIYMPIFQIIREFLMAEYIR